MKDEDIFWRGMPETNYNHPAYQIATDLRLLEGWKNNELWGALRRDKQPFDEEVYEREKRNLELKLKWARRVGV